MVSHNLSFFNYNYLFTDFFTVAFIFCFPDLSIITNIKTEVDEYLELITIRIIVLLKESENISF